MCNRIWRIATLVICAVLLAGCGGGAPTASPMPAATAVPTATATPAPTATPTPEPFRATVVDVINEVDAHPLPEEDWVAAQAEMAIYEGGEVWAKEASTARVGVMENLIRVAPNTIFTLNQPDANTLRLSLDEGQVWVNVEGLQPGQVFEVETPAAVASVRGTRFGVRAESGGATVVSSQIDTVTVSTAAGAVDVGAGFQTTVEASGSPSAPEPMSPCEQARWGLAGGPNLDVVLPVVGLTAVFSYPYNISDPTLSSDGNYFAGIYYVPLEEEGHFRPEPMLYDIQTGQVSTATLPGNASGVAYNPDGPGMVYERHSNICTANDDWSGASCFGDTYFNPSWSPDGEWLAFMSYEDGAINLFKARPDGSELTRLTSNSTGYVSNAAWSPDASQIAYTFYTDYEQPAELWVMNADGSGSRQLLPQVGHGDPLWNRDGSALVVSGYGEGEYGSGGGLWQVPLDGGDPVQLPGTAGWTCWGATWSPTPSGWPLFFHGASLESARHNRPGKPGLAALLAELPGYGVENGRYRGPVGGGKYGIWWLFQDSAAPTYFSDADWGPLFDTGLAAFGYDTGSREAPETTVYFFQLEPGFWSE